MPLASLFMAATPNTITPMAVASKARPMPGFFAPDTIPPVKAHIEKSNMTMLTITIRPPVRMTPRVRSVLAAHCSMS
jgi:hypothetical protein